MTFWETFKEDMKSAVPDKLVWIRNKKTGALYFEVVNKPNRFVPRRTRILDNEEVHIIESNEDIYAKGIMDAIFGGEVQRVKKTKKVVELVDNSYRQLSQ